MAELDDITNERDNFRQAFENLRKQRLNEFMAGFNVITNKLKENYQMLTLGGDAELELVDSLDPFSEGIVFRLVKRSSINTVICNHPVPLPASSLSNSLCVFQEFPPAPDLLSTTTLIVIVRKLQTSHLFQCSASEEKLEEDI